MYCSCQTLENTVLCSPDSLFISKTDIRSYREYHPPQRKTMEGEVVEDPHVVLVERILDEIEDLWAPGDTESYDFGNKYFAQAGVISILGLIGDLEAYYNVTSHGSDVVITRNSIKSGDKK